MKKKSLIVLFMKTCFLFFFVSITLGRSTNRVSSDLPFTLNESSRDNTRLFYMTATYIFGYQNTQVMAIVLNANRDQVAFSSFETGDKGFWSYNGTTAGGPTDLGRTGGKYYELSTGSIQRTNLLAGKYLLTYWEKGGVASISGTNYTLISQTTQPAINGWVYRENVISLSASGSSITLNGNLKIDELRLYPVEARMTSYTFDLLVGKTSETDDNNRTIYYEYDEFNRLKCIKDQFGNITKNYVYHYKNQL